MYLTETTSSVIDSGVFIAIPAFIFLVFIIGHSIKMSRAEKKLKKSLPVGVLRLKAAHAMGLPIAEKTECLVYSYPACIKIVAPGTEFVVKKEKTTDISITTDEDIQKQYISSVGGAVGGAVLFGPLGAMIGGRSKEKKVTTVTNYFIITYLKEEGLKYICFTYSFNEYQNAKNIIADFTNGSVKASASIEL